MSPKEVEKILLKDGWVFKNAKGDHYHYVHPTKPGKVTVFCKYFLEKIAN